MTHRSVAILVVALLSVSLPARAQDAASPWDGLTLDGEVVVATGTPNGSGCLAAATERTLYIVDASGGLLWQWHFRETNRFIPVSWSTKLAVSPDCLSVVLAGNTGYKYVWAASRDGEPRFIPTAGTPLSVAYSIDGTTVAVVTGAFRGYLLTPTLAIRWSGRTVELPVRWPEQVGGVGGESAVTFAREHVDALVPGLTWGWGADDDVSDDGQWRVVRAQEFRGVGPGSVEFFGPDAGGFHGRLLRQTPRWRVAAGCPHAELSVDSEFVLVVGDYANPKSQCDADVVRAVVYDRDGSEVASVEAAWPAFERLFPENQAALAAAVMQATGKPLRLKER